MCQGSLARLRAARAREPEQVLWNRVSDLPPPPQLKLSPEGFDLIAECKLRSPSAGDLSAHTQDFEARIVDYARGGAAAVSVLTEPDRFGGDLAHLERAAALLAPLGVPAMRKDFLVDPYQVLEARAAGAAGVLVIIRMLDTSHITALLDCAAMLRMFVLLEAFDAADLAATKELLGSRGKREETILAGLNCRDLDRLSVDLDRLAQLADKLPEDRIQVAESGVSSLDDVRHIVDLGYDMALVGTALMGSAEPRQLVGAMLAAGRERAIARRKSE